MPTPHPASEPRKFSASALMCLVCLQTKKHSPSFQSRILLYKNCLLNEPPPPLLFGESTLDFAPGPTFADPRMLGNASLAQGRLVEGDMEESPHPGVLMRTAPSALRARPQVLPAACVSPGLSFCHMWFSIQGQVPPAICKYSDPMEPSEAKWHETKKLLPLIYMKKRVCSKAPARTYRITRNNAKT